MKLTPTQARVLRDAKDGHVYRSQSLDLGRSYDRSPNAANPTTGYHRNVTAIVDKLQQAGLLKIGEQVGLRRPWIVTELGIQALGALDV